MKKKKNKTKKYLETQPMFIVKMIFILENRYYLSSIVDYWNCSCEIERLRSAWFVCYQKIRSTNTKKQKVISQRNIRQTNHFNYNVQKHNKNELNLFSNVEIVWVEQQRTK
jgi:hypothetical protein